MSASRPRRPICVMTQDMETGHTPERSYAARWFLVRNAMPRRSSARQSHLSSRARRGTRSTIAFLRLDLAEKRDYPQSIFNFQCDCCPKVVTGEPTSMNL
eukprot:scaffold33468_cov68-Phaeocystis_antarctica.AAC.1